MKRSNLKKVSNTLLNKENHHLFYDVIKKSVLTEKSTTSETKNKIMTCIVPNWMDKIFIKKSFESIFDVRVARVNVMNITGKTKKSRSKQNNFFKKQDVKKAMIKVDSVSKIANTLKENKGVIK